MNTNLLVIPVDECTLVSKESLSEEPIFTLSLNNPTSEKLMTTSEGIVPAQDESMSTSQRDTPPPCSNFALQSELQTNSPVIPLSKDLVLPSKVALISMQKDSTLSSKDALMEEIKESVTLVDEKQEIHSLRRSKRTLSESGVEVEPVSKRMKGLPVDLTKRMASSQDGTEDTMNDKEAAKAAKKKSSSTETEKRSSKKSSSQKKNEKNVNTMEQSIEKHPLENHDFNKIEQEVSTIKKKSSSKKRKSKKKVKKSSKKVLNSSEIPVKDINMLEIIEPGTSGTEKKSFIQYLVTADVHEPNTIEERVSSTKEKSNIGVKSEKSPHVEETEITLTTKESHVKRMADENISFSENEQVHFSNRKKHDDTEVKITKETPLKIEKVGTSLSNTRESSTERANVDDNSQKENDNSSASILTKKQRRNEIDHNDPIFHEPFKCGWRRELVFRSPSSIRSKKQRADVYYYTPRGEKIRSRTKLENHLKDQELTLENFTFRHESLGIDDPDKELIRYSRKKNNHSSNNSSTMAHKMRSLNKSLIDHEKSKTHSVHRDDSFPEKCNSLTCLTSTDELNSNSTTSADDLKENSENLMPHFDSCNKNIELIPSTVNIVNYSSLYTNQEPEKANLINTFDEPVENPLESVLDHKIELIKNLGLLPSTNEIQTKIDNSEFDDSNKTIVEESGFNATRIESSECLMNNKRVSAEVLPSLTINKNSFLSCQSALSITVEPQEFIHLKSSENELSDVYRQDLLRENSSDTTTFDTSKGSYHEKQQNLLMTVDQNNETNNLNNEFNYEKTSKISVESSASYGFDHFNKGSNNSLSIIKSNIDCPSSENSYSKSALSIAIGSQEIESLFETENGTINSSRGKSEKVLHEIGSRKINASNGSVENVEDAQGIHRVVNKNDFQEIDCSKITDFENSDDSFEEFRGFKSSFSEKIELPNNAINRNDSVSGLDIPTIFDEKTTTKAGVENRKINSKIELVQGLQESSSATINENCSHESLDHNIRNVDGFIHKTESPMKYVSSEEILLSNLITSTTEENFDCSKTSENIELHSTNENALQNSDTDSSKMSECRGVQKNFYSTVNATNEFVENVESVIKSSFDVISSSSDSSDTIMSIKENAALTKTDRNIEPHCIDESVSKNSEFSKISESGILLDELKSPTFVPKVETLKNNSPDISSLPDSTTAKLSISLKVDKNIEPNDTIIIKNLSQNTIFNISTESSHIQDNLNSVQKSTENSLDNFKYSIENLQKYPSCDQSKNFINELENGCKTKIQSLFEVSNDSSSLNSSKNSIKLEKSQISKKCDTKNVLNAMNENTLKEIVTHEEADLIGFTVKDIYQHITLHTATKSSNDLQEIQHQYPEKLGDADTKLVTDVSDLLVNENISNKKNCSSDLNVLVTGAQEFNTVETLDSIMTIESKNDSLDSTKTVTDSSPEDSECFAADISFQNTSGCGTMSTSKESLKKFDEYLIRNCVTNGNSTSGQDTLNSFTSSMLTEMTSNQENSNRPLIENMFQGPISSKTAEPSDLCVNIDGKENTIHPLKKNVFNKETSVLLPDTLLNTTNSKQDNYVNVPDAAMETECSFKCTPIEIEQLNRILESGVEKESSSADDTLIELNKPSPVELGLESSSQAVKNVYEAIKLPESVRVNNQIGAEITFDENLYPERDPDFISVSQNTSVSTDCVNMSYESFHSSSLIPSTTGLQKPLRCSTFKRMKLTLPLTSAYPHSMVSFCAGYSALKLIFEYLNFKDLLVAKQVCKIWQELAERPALWKRVRLNNSQLTNSLANIFYKHGTEHLSIVNEVSDNWDTLIGAVSKIKSLRELELCSCPSFALEEIIENCSQLQVVSASSIKSESFDVECLKNLTNSKKIHLRAATSMSLKGDLKSLLECSSLTHLSLRSIQNLGKKNIQVLQFLKNLRTLELGECSEFPNIFGSTVLIKLKKLERLRLEKMTGSCCTVDIFTNVAKLEKLTELELVNIDITNGFENCLPKCKNITKLLVIPVFDRNRAAVLNSIVLQSTVNMSSNLKQFVWGITEESLQLSKEFCENLEDDYISVSRSMSLTYPNLSEKLDITGDEQTSVLNTSELDMLPLSSLQEFYADALPETQVEILKIPVSTTWNLTM